MKRKVHRKQKLTHADRAKLAHKAPVRTPNGRVRYLCKSCTYYNAYQQEFTCPEGLGPLVRGAFRLGFLDHCDMRVARHREEDKFYYGRRQLEYYKVRAYSPATMFRKFLGVARTLTVPWKQRGYYAGIPDRFVDGKRMLFLEDVELIIGRAIKDGAIPLPLQNKALGKIASEKGEKFK